PPDPRPPAGGRARRLATRQQPGHRPRRRALRGARADRRRARPRHLLRPPRAGEAVSRAARVAVLAAAASLSLHLAAAARAAAPPIARPNPSLALLQVDYATPPAGPGGGPTMFAPLDPSVIDAAVADQAFLTFQLRDDLGGFLPAPVGTLALEGVSGHVLAGKTNGQAEIPQFAQAAGGDV